MEDLASPQAPGLRDPSDREVQNGRVAPPPEALLFLRMVRRVQTLMIWISAAVVLVCSIAAAALDRYGGIQFLLIAAAIAGFCWLIVGVDGSVLLRRAEKLSVGPSQTMDMKTSLLRSTKSMVSNRVLVTLTPIGAASDSKVTFKARWFTPGMAEAPLGTAKVFEARDGRSVAFAVTDRGGVLGRPLRTKRHP